MPLAKSAPMLEGVRVVDLTTVVFGPYCTQMLADLGADVIKVESPEGDTFRYSGKPAQTRGMSPGQLAINRGKRSVVLNLKDPDDNAAMKALLEGADLFIHNVRRQAIERLGLGYEAVKAINPNIIYVHCVGFGSDGPYADLQAYDDVIQAATGTATLASRVDGDPRARYIPSLIADKVAGLHGAHAALAAIIHRLRTGEGQFVEVPMFEAFTNFMLKEHFGGLTVEPPVGSVGYFRQIDPDRQPFPTADGYISIVTYNDAAIFKLFDLMGEPEFMKQEHLATPLLRLRNMSKVYQGIARLTPAKTTAEWVKILHDAQIPAMPVRDLADILDDPHLKETGFFTLRQHPTEGAFYDMKSPIRFGAVQPPPPAPAATLGQHTEAVRKGLWDAEAG